MRESREWVTAVGTGRSTGVKSETFVSYECKKYLREKKNQLVRGSLGDLCTEKGESFVLYVK